MFSSPKYFYTISMKLSEVLDDVGVNEVMVYKMRYAHLLDEKMMTITYRPSGLSVYNFGSLSEGTTTAGLQSDADTLTCHHELNVIQDYREWKPGYCNLLMIQNETTSPGYCLLQLLRDDVPLPVTYIPNQHCFRVTPDRVLFKNTFHKDFIPAKVIHGPAWSEHRPPGLRDVDYVPAFHCKSWPHDAKDWLDGQKFGRWPAQDIKKYAENSGCFVVPVGSKVSQNEALEWRISTSQAERFLMFSLNITQIRCYVLMKMILKTYLNHHGEAHISSFMCKTVLLRCIENTDTNAWQEHNLLKCLSNCLMVLYQNLLQGNCPHFIIPGNNLMAGQFSVKTKHALLNNLQYLLQTAGPALLGIQIDDLGQRLRTRLTMVYQIKRTMPSASKKVFILDGLLETIAFSLNSLHNKILHEQTDDNSGPTIQHLVKALSNITQYNIKGSNLEQEAGSLLAPLVCSSMGCIIASLNINNSNTVSQDAFDWLIPGQNSDVSSGRLKLASVFYCVGNVVKTEAILREIERCYNLLSVEPICGCYDFSRPYMKKKFQKASHTEGIAQSIIMNTAFCVKFTPAEIHCVPQELQYEMFRSTENDLLLRDGDFWMDWAVVDSLPYFYFLKFKTCARLQQYDDQYQALINLHGTILIEYNLGHRETAWNLLGQCMEQINQPTNALLCYIKSLHTRQRNNAAGIHICRLLTKLMISRT